MIKLYIRECRDAGCVNEVNGFALFDGLEIEVYFTFAIRKGVDNEH